MDSLAIDGQGRSGPDRPGMAEALSRARLQIESLIDETDELMRQLEAAKVGKPPDALSSTAARELAEQLVPAVIYRLSRCAEAASCYVESG